MRRGAIRGDIDEKRGAIVVFSVANDGDTVPSWNALKRRNGHLRHNSLCRGAPTTTAMRHKLQLAPPYLQEYVRARADVAARYVPARTCGPRSFLAVAVATLTSLRELGDHNAGSRRPLTMPAPLKWNTWGGYDMRLECRFLIPHSGWGFLLRSHARNASDPIHFLDEVNSSSICHIFFIKRNFYNALFAVF